MKIISRISIALLILLGLLMGTSYVVGRMWGKDLDLLDVTSGERSFKAKRNEMGVWTFSAKTPQDFGFALGYLHAQDREFQTELFRLLGTGRLASVFGEALLPRDRLMRFSAEVAKAEWAALEKNPEHASEVAVLRAYVAGRKAFLANPATHEPIEYRVFGLTRAKQGNWEPWEVLAVSRAHSFEFSYDFKDDLLRRSLLNHLGPQLGALFTPSEPILSHALYDEPMVKGLRKDRLADTPELKSHLKARPDPAFFFPPGSKSAHQGAKKDQQLASVKGFGFSGDGFGLGAELGASNLWVVSDPKKGLDAALCNDTHLGLAWPSMLYPMEYEITDARLDAKSGEAFAVKGTGFSMPGLPMMIIGRIENKATADLMVWGITMANFADVQDLIELDEATLKKSVIQEQSYAIRDIKANQTVEKVIQESWTAFGPRVDGIVDWEGNVPKKAVALDWLGYRQTQTPFAFFLKRSFGGARDLRSDLAHVWDYPAVNFTWIERSKGAMRTGHSITGMIFEAPSVTARAAHRELISETVAKARKISFASQRPFLDLPLDKKSPMFFVTGNQRPWSGDLSLKLAYQWHDSARADRVVALASDLALKPEYSQTDSHSTQLVDFLKVARTEISADRLCGTLDPSMTKPCIDILSEIDGWDGRTQQEKWEPTLVSLWLQNFKKGMWPEGKLEIKEDSQVARFRGWNKSSMADRLVRAVLQDKEVRQRWEMLSGRTFSDVLLGSFRESLEVLSTQLGPMTANWGWGGVHRIDWAHPFAKIPGGLGPILRDSALGPPPPVSGGADSPGVMSYSWSPRQPLDFSGNHAAVMRMCTSFESGQKTTLRWANVTGVSGNPFSKWAWILPQETYFKDALFNQDAAPDPKK